MQDNRTGEQPIQAELARIRQHRGGRPTPKPRMSTPPAWPGWRLTLNDDERKSGDYDPNGNYIPLTERDRKPRCLHCQDQGFVTLRVPVGDPRFGKAIPCPTCQGGEALAAVRLDKQVKMARLLAESGLTETARHDWLTWDHFTPESIGRDMWDPRALGIELARMWSQGDALNYDVFGLEHPFAAANPATFEFRDTNSLGLYGPTGSGKTGLARLAYRDYLRTTGTPGIFVEWQALYESIKSQYGKTGDENQSYPIIEAVATIPVLLLDDIGHQRRQRPVGEDEYNKLWLIVNRRYTNRLKTLFTSNLDRHQLAEQFDSKLVGRLAEMAVLCEMGGRSFREYDQEA